MKEKKISSDIEQRKNEEKWKSKKEKRTNKQTRLDEYL